MAVKRYVHRAAVAVQLAAARALEPGGGGDLGGRLTVVVKTFERPRVARRFVRSLLRLHTGVEVVVVDDSREPRPVEGARLIALPHASGVSAGRRAGLAAVRTEYVAMVDDDMVLTRRSDLGRAVRYLDAHPEVDLVGGKVVNLPRLRSRDYATAPLFASAAEPVVPPGTLIGGLPVHEKVPTFYVARTERLRLVDWDPALKRLDHADFFTRARGVLTTVYDARMRCLHARTPFDPLYAAARADYAADAELLRARWDA